MDLLIKLYSPLFTVFLFFKGISSFQAVQTLTPELPVLGDSFTLRCSFTLSSNLESLQALDLQRKRTDDQDFTRIVTFPPVNAAGNPSTIEDTSLTNRIVVENPNSDFSTSATVVFNSTACSDKAVYKWVYRYYSGRYFDDSKSTEVKIKVIGSLESSSGYGITDTSPGNDVTEGTNVTVTCKADVGAEPQGELEWDYYTTDPSVAYPVSDMASKTGVPPDISCSSGQESVLTLPMTADLNGIYIRCTLKQGGVPDKYSVTNNSFNVRYSARQTAVNPNPLGPEYTEGDAQVTLTCNSRANPAPSYTWVLPNGTEVAGVTYTLQNLQINDTGSYTCVAKNGVPDENATDSKIFQLTVNEVAGVTYTLQNVQINDTGSYTCVAKNGVPNENVTDIKVFQLTVNEKTTTTTTTSSTTPARSSTTPKNGDGNTGKSTANAGPSDSTIIITVVCVMVGVGIIIAIIIIVICKRKKQQEVEEHPEKPRNYQDLIFYENSKPGLTTSNEQVENFANYVNTSLNSHDGTDSKPHNPDGLMYSELQFEDKSRSPQPIQIYDNCSTDIAVPRV